MKSFERLKKPGKLAERVQYQLEQLILSGQVKVNEQLPTEMALAESFGVSRTVVREAIHRLEAQGMVRAKVGSGTCVIPMEKDQIRVDDGAIGRVGLFAGNVPEPARSEAGDRGGNVAPAGGHPRCRAPSPPWQRRSPGCAS